MPQRLPQDLLRIFLFPAAADRPCCLGAGIAEGDEGLDRIGGRTGRLPGAGSPNCASGRCEQVLFRSLLPGRCIGRSHLVLQIQDEQLPAMIMADPADFDALWDKFVEDITPSATAFGNFMQEAVYAEAHKVLDNK